MASARPRQQLGCHARGTIRCDGCLRPAWHTVACLVAVAV